MNSYTLYIEALIQTTDYWLTKNVAIKHVKTYCWLIYTHVHVHTHACTCTHIRIHTHAYTHVYTHTYTHTYTHIHTTNKYNRQQIFKHTDTYTHAQRHINLLVTCSNLSCSRKVNRESGNSLRYCFNKLATTLASQLDKSTASPVDNTQPVVKLCYCHNIHKKRINDMHIYVHA